MKGFWAQSVISICLLGAMFNPFAQAAMPYDKGQKLMFAAAGSYDGIDENKAVDIHHLSVGAAYYLTGGLGVYGEALAIVTRGMRDGTETDTEGIGAFFALRWHFIRTARWSLYLNHGIGPVWFIEEFPPGGTKLNALTQYSLGMSTRIGDSSILNLGLRHSHISNGKGMVAENPAFDGTGIYLEIAKPF